MAAHYEIHLQGHFDTDWANWLGNFSLTHTADGCTVLSGEVVDQAALHSLLTRIRDLGAPLLLVRRHSSTKSRKVAENL